jgi:hypothetical protein
MLEIKQIYRMFSQYYAKFQDIAADVVWNHSALGNDLGMVMTKELKDSFIYSDMCEEHRVFVTVCQTRDYQICQ